MVLRWLRLNDNKCLIVDGANNQITRNPTNIVFGQLTGFHDLNFNGIFRYLITWLIMFLSSKSKEAYRQEIQ